MGGASKLFDNSHIASHHTPHHTSSKQNKSEYALDLLTAPSLLPAACRQLAKLMDGLPEEVMESGLRSAGWRDGTGGPPLSRDDALLAQARAVMTAEELDVSDYLWRQEEEEDGEWGGGGGGAAGGRGDGGGFAPNARAGQGARGSRAARRPRLVMAPAPPSHGTAGGGARRRGRGQVVVPVRSELPRPPPPRRPPAPQQRPGSPVGGGRLYGAAGGLRPLARGFPIIM